MCIREVLDKYQVERILIIRQGRVGLKACFTRLCLKSLEQIHQLTLREYQTSSRPQSSVVHHLHNLIKSIQSCRIVPHVTKIQQKILFTQVYIYLGEYLLWYLHHDIYCDSGLPYNTRLNTLTNNIFILFPSTCNDDVLFLSHNHLHI